MPDGATHILHLAIDSPDHGESVDGPGGLDEFTLRATHGRLLGARDSHRGSELRDPAEGIDSCPPSRCGLRRYRTFVVIVQVDVIGEELPWVIPHHADRPGDSHRRPRKLVIEV